MKQSMIYHLYSFTGRCSRSCLVKTADTIVPADMLAVRSNWNLCFNQEVRLWLSNVTFETYNEPHDPGPALPQSADYVSVCWCGHWETDTQTHTQLSKKWHHGSRSARGGTEPRHPFVFKATAVMSSQAGLWTGFALKRLAVTHLHTGASSFPTFKTRQHDKGTLCGPNTLISYCFAHSKFKPQVLCVIAVQWWRIRILLCYLEHRTALLGFVNSYTE